MYIFTHEPKHYTGLRNLNIIEQWKHQTAHHLARVRNKSYEEMREFIEWGLANGSIPFHDPDMIVFRKDENRDRYETRMKLTEYLKEIHARQLLLAPTLTCYLNNNTLPSRLADFTEVKFYLRKKTKKESQNAKSEGMIELSVRKNNQQNKQKEEINSISGLLTIESTPCANRSGHSTLTSTCRIATAFANANTERLFQGRRHFFSVESVINNITGILAYADLEQCEKIIEKYGFHYVTVDELYESLRYSWHDYWRSKKYDDYIYQYLQTLTPLERTAYLYMGDMWHLRKYNEDFMRMLLGDILSFPDVEPISLEETDQELHQVDEFFESIAAMSVSDLVGMKPIHHPDHRKETYYGIMGARIKHIRLSLYKYEDYFQCFCRHGHIPAEIAHFPHVIRKSVLGGDTDSTLFTVMQWVVWYNGTTRVDEVTRRTSVTMIYFLCMIVKHTLATVTGQMGVIEKYIHNLKMKNEFFFNAFVPSNRTKHYISTSTMCEGRNTSLDVTIKGVALKNSKSKKEVTDRFEEMAVDVMETVARGELVDEKTIMREIAKMEAEIFNSIMHGDTNYLTSRAIKVKEAYRIPMSSDYANHELWTDVFEDKYGSTPPPPYEGVRISMNLPNKTAIQNWIAGIQDKQLAERLTKFIKRTDRNAVRSIILPYDVVASTGIPDEIKPFVDARKVIYANMEQFYVLLEMLGIYRSNEWYTKLILDEHMDLIPDNLRDYFSGEKRTQLQKAIQATKRHGVHYEEWDVEVGEMLEIDDDGNIITSNEDIEDTSEDDD